MAVQNNPLERARYPFSLIAINELVNLQTMSAPMDNPAYPRSKSKEAIDVLYTSAPINKSALFLAQQYARFARNCSGKVAEGYVNKANYLMTEAYEGGEENKAFWDQFA